MLWLLAAAAALPQISDTALRTLELRKIDPRLALSGHVLGLNHGMRVLVEYPCSDICPDYTVRIIHYDVAPGEPCRRAGGVTVTRMVPVSIAEVPRKYCVPRAIVELRR